MLSRTFNLIASSLSFPIKDWGVVGAGEATVDESVCLAVSVFSWVCFVDGLPLMYFLKSSLYVPENPSAVNPPKFSNRETKYGTVKLRVLPPVSSSSP